MQFKIGKLRVELENQTEVRNRDRRDVQHNKIKSTCSFIGI